VRIWLRLHSRSSGIFAFWTAHRQLCYTVVVQEINRMPATIELSLPDNLVRVLGSNAAELPRQALEALVAQTYRAGKLTHAQVGEALGLDRWETDGFLKASQAQRAWESEEFSADLKNLRSISK
jgi:hypothetical protein